jgi:anti-anti-sigma regulatory factor
MIVTGNKEAGAVVVSTSTYLSGRAGEDLEREFERNLADGNRNFIIDFGKTEIVNSIGVSILIGIIERIIAREGTIRFANLNAVNEEIFRMMGLLRYAPLVERH